MNKADNLRFTLHLLKYLGFLFLLLNACTSHAQPQKQTSKPTQFRAVQWTIYDGLTQGENYAMLKDKYGFLWVSSKNGLNRFDGNSFKNYFPEKGNNHAITDKFIMGLVEDSLHNIWIGSPTGLMRYDIKADTFSSFSISKTAPGEDISSQVFWATKDQILTIEGKASIVAYNIHSFDRKVLSKTFPDEMGIGLQYQNSIYEEASKAVWILAAKRNGLYRISLSNGDTTYFDIPRYWKDNTKEFRPSEALCYDQKRNCIWINNTEGLIEFSLGDRQMHHVEAFKELVKLKGYDPIVGVDLDLQGRVWLSTIPKGILIYDPEDKSIHLPFKEDSVLQFNISAANGIIYGDRDGIIWTGSWELERGIYEITPYSPVLRHYIAAPNHKNSLKSDAVHTLVQADQGRIWISAFQGKGLQFFDPSTDNFYTYPLKDFSGLNGSNFDGNIEPVYVDTLLNKAWINAGGLFEMDLTTRKCVPVIFKDSLGKIIQPPDHFFYVNSSSTVNNSLIGASKFGEKIAIVAVDKARPEARPLLSFPDGMYYPFIICANDSLLFLKSNQPELANMTFSMADHRLIRRPTPLDSLQYGEIIFNKMDFTYWVTTENQLIHYNKDFQIIKVYTTKEGLPPIQLSALVLDNNGNLWFKTDRSIHLLNTKTENFSLLSVNDGFENQVFFNYPSAIKGDKGEIYMYGGWAGKGFNRINPELYKSFSTSSIYLRSLEINQQPFALNTGINDLQELSLSYFQNRIAIETGVIDYYSKGKSRIRFKLEGLDENWQYAPANYTIRYDNLPARKYTLRIQASNAGNEFNGPEKVVVFTIRPPFWDTWWFRILAVGTLGGLLYAFIQYRSRTLRKQNVLLEEKVMHRTKELKHSLEDLRGTQAQLIQSEKMASLGELTAGIAHEIQNPLNFVNNFSEINTELFDELNQELTSGNNEGAIAIAHDLQENERKINHHGKRADAIVKNMLQHSRTSTGIKEPTDINALADEYLRLSYHGLRAKDKSFNAALNTDFESGLPKINVIPQEIGRVILNLINNAFYAVAEKKKMSIPGYGPAVTVGTRRNGDKVEISVRDNGNGIPPKLIYKIFQPFFTTKPTGEGTGLGLSLSYDIVTKVHHGELKVETKEGEGSVFTIQLPV